MAIVGLGRFNGTPKWDRFDPTQGACSHDMSNRLILLDVFLWLLFIVFNDTFRTKMISVALLLSPSLRLALLGCKTVAEFVLDANILDQGLPVRVKHDA